MALVENWGGNMYNTMSVVGVGQQPLRDANQYIAFLYIIFMIIGSITIINLVVGVSINKVRRRCCCRVVMMRMHAGAPS